MSNLATMPATSAAKHHKQPAETVLATLEAEGNYINHCRDVLVLEPFTEFWTNDPLSKIEARLAQNRAMLSRVPVQAEVEKFARIVGIALECKTESVLKRQLGLLLGAFPNVALPNADVFIDMLTYDINDAGYSDAIVFLTCRDLRRTHRFFPTIAEFLSTAESHDNHWRQALNLPDRMLLKRQELQNAVAKAERCLQQADDGVADGWRDEEGKLLKPRPLPPSLARLAANG